MAYGLKESNSTARERGHGCVITLPGAELSLFDSTLRTDHASTTLRPGFVRVLAALADDFGNSILQSDLMRRGVSAHAPCSKVAFQVTLAGLRRALRHAAPHLAIRTVSPPTAYALMLADTEIAPRAMAGGLTAVSSQTCAAGAEVSAAAFSSEPAGV